MLAGNPGAKVLAGGQTLGPMLNLRLAQPTLLVDITRIPELAAVTEDADAVTIGATVTHAAVEDGRVTDPTGGFLARVARGIAYRAVRNRGTIGGSLAHADPAADWLSCLSALGAHVMIAGAAGTRRVGLAGFVRGALETELGGDELLTAVRIPKFSRAARFGFHKICRKTGEFADAIGVVAYDPERQLTRIAASTGVGPPVVIDARDLLLDRGELPDTERPTAAPRAGGPRRRRLRPQAAHRRRAARHTPRCSRHDAHRPHRQRQGRRGRGGPAHAPGRLPARAAPPHRHAHRLRARHLRRLHGGDRRRDRPLLHHLRGGLRRRARAHHRGLRRRRRHGPPAPGLHRGARPAVRLLHARHADRRARPGAPQARPVARRDPHRDEREFVPLHRLHGHRRRHRAGDGRKG